MNRMVKRCDVCGADDRKDNPVCVHVSQVVETPQSDTYTSYILTLGGPTRTEVGLDLCKACGGGLLDLLRHAKKRHDAEAKLKPKPSASALSDYLVLSSMADERGES
jgi:hypothetical protein